MDSEEERIGLLQACANFCKSIASAYDKAGPEFSKQSKAYWLRSAGYEEDILAFLDRRRGQLEK